MENDTSSFQGVAADWAALSSEGTITGEFLGFFKGLGVMAKNLGDVLSVVNKYI